MVKKIRTLLIGANGIIGTTLAHELNGSGIELTVVSRKKPFTGLKFVQHSADKSSNNLNKKIKGKIDVIVINSGYINETDSISGQINNYQVNVKYLVDLLQFAKDKKVKKIIYTSTLAFLQKPFLKTITEDHPVATNTLYGAAKYLAESAIIAFCKENGIDYFCFRIPSPVNVKELDLHNNVLKIWYSNAGKGNDLTIFGKGKRHQNFVNTQDISKIYKQAILNNKRSGIYNLAATNSLSMIELAVLIAKKKKVKVVRMPQQAEDISYKNISIKKLNAEFNISSFHSSKETILKLINNTK